MNLQRVDFADVVRHGNFVYCYMRVDGSPITSASGTSPAQRQSTAPAAAACKSPATVPASASASASCAQA